jgi:ABC-type glycerol-3-phosphate transport system substrate-binding protein
MITKMKQKSTIAVLLLAIATLSLGCGGGKGGVGNQDVTLRYWRPFADSQEMQVLINEYQSKHPNVTIEYAKRNIETYEDDLVNALASGTGPDIFAVNNTWVPKYLDKVTPAPEALVTLKDYKDSFVDVVVNDFTRGSNIYGVALSVDSLALYYNKALLGTAGIATPAKTWRELESHVQRLTVEDRSGYFTRSGVALGLNNNINRGVDVLYLLMLQRGVVPWSSDGLSPTFSQSVNVNGTYSNPGSEALDYYTSFANPNSQNYTWNTLSDYSIDAFANGRAAYLYSYPYTARTIRQKSPSLNFDVAPVPQASLDVPAVNFANYFGEVVSKQSKNKEWAWDFLNFISSKQVLDKYYASYKYPSSRKDLIELQIKDPEIGVFAHANLTARSFYKPDQKRLDDIMGTLIDNVVLRGLSIDEALSQAESQAATLTQVR